MSAQDYNTPTKICSKCYCDYPATSVFFRKKKGRPYGLDGVCKKCHAARKMQYDASQVEHIRFNWRKASKKHRTSNPLHVRELAKLQRLRRIEEHRAHGRDQYYKHRDKKRMYSKAYAAAHPEKGRIRMQRRRARVRSLPSSFTTQDWNRAIEYWHGACAYCGNGPSLFDLRPELQCDHFVPLALPSSPGTVKGNMLPACQKCNLSKHDKEPHLWLVKCFGKRKASQIETRITAYFEWIRNNDL